MSRRHASIVVTPILIVLAGLVGLHVAAPAAHAQDKHWGVSATLIPRWDPVPEIYDLLYGASSVDGDGREFRIGIARGSDLGGDWSVAFVRSTIAEGTMFDELFPFDGADGPRVGDFALAGSDLRIDGIKFDGFTPFVTIKERVQVGIAWGAGVGWLKGSVEEHNVEVQVDFPPPTFEPVFGDVVDTVTVLDVTEEVDFTTIPLGNVEVAVAVIVAPGFKVRVSGGFNFPNTQVFSITANYLIGAR